MPQTMDLIERSRALRQLDDLREAAAGETSPDDPFAPLLPDDGRMEWLTEMFGRHYPLGAPAPVAITLDDSGAVIFDFDLRDRAYYLAVDLPGRIGILDRAEPDPELLATLELARPEAWAAVGPALLRDAGMDGRPSHVGHCWWAMLRDAIYDYRDLIQSGRDSVVWSRAAGHRLLIAGERCGDNYRELRAGLAQRHPEADRLVDEVYGLAAALHEVKDPPPTHPDWGLE